MPLILTDSFGPRGAGYLEIDNRASGGAPGDAKELPPGAQRYFEADTYTCSHCNVVVIMNPARTRERYKCNGCKHHICDPCAAKKYAGEPCRTMDQIADEVREQALRQSAGGILLP